MQVKKLTSPGRYADGNCLYLTISELGSKSWLLRIVVRGRRRDVVRGRRRDMGLAVSILSSLKKRVILPGSIGASPDQAVILC